MAVGMVRDAVVQDAAAIAAVHVQSWHETYAGVLPPDFLGALDEDQRRDGWRRILADGVGSTAVASVGERIVGFAHGAPVEPDGAASWQLVAIYVLRQHQRGGIGAALHDAVVGKRATRLDVWEGNAAALRFYRRLGYARCGAAGAFIIGGHEIPTITLVRRSLL